jgi:hypothetical protein
MDEEAIPPTIYERIEELKQEAIALTEDIIILNTKVKWLGTELEALYNDVKEGD